VLSIFTDLGMKQILFSQCYNIQKMCLRLFKIYIYISFPATGLFLQEWTTLAKKNSCKNVLLNTAEKSANHPPWGPTSLSFII
jgi:hypothetical protein